MQTIEIIGPPGAGKTTYVENISDPKMYSERLDTFTRSLPSGLLFQKIPFNQSFSRRVFSYIRPRYEQKFISRFPGLLETAAPIIRDCKNKKGVLNKIFGEAAWFEFFLNHLDSNETYVIDDGLYQYHLRLLLIEGWTAERIMNKLPEPDKFIFIDAPGEICLERQDSRSKGRHPKLTGLSQTEAINKIETMRSDSKRFISEARNRGIKIEELYFSN